MNEKKKFKKEIRKLLKEALVFIFTVIALVALIWLISKKG